MSGATIAILVLLAVIAATLLVGLLDAHHALRDLAMGRAATGESCPERPET